MLSLYFKTKPELAADKRHLVELFFLDWIDTVSENDVNVEIESTGVYSYKVDFNKPEDALAVKLKGVPCEFNNLIELVR